jgi:short-subunit dehydrogenase
VAGSAVTAAGPRVVVIFGASSGIGRAAAHAFAERGDHLVIGARGAAALETTRVECSGAGAASVTASTLDIREAERVSDVLTQTVATHGRVDVVVNAATVMAYGRIEDVPAAVFDTVIDTAIHGTANVARAALPIFRRQGRGILLVVNSLLGYITSPGMGGYVTAKWGQLGLLRLLQLETRDAPDVHVSFVVPGAVDTPIYRVAANFLGRSPAPPPPVDSPEKVARRIIQCVDHPRPRVSVGVANPLIIAGFRVLPRLFDVLVGPLMDRFGLGSDLAPPTAGNVLAPTPDGYHTSGGWQTGLIHPLADRLRPTKASAADRGP